MRDEPGEQECHPIRRLAHGGDIAPPGHLTHSGHDRTKCGRPKGMKACTMADQLTSSVNLISARRLAAGPLV
jgi:hypothetical protein